MFKTYVSEIENEFSKKIKRLCSDKGNEYDFIIFNEFYKYVIVHEMTAPYSPKMNCKEERNNIILLNLLLQL